MGIGNRSHRHHPGRHGGHLITPHGDRKLGCGHPSPTTAGIHYPSWGSETADQRRELARTRHLITPHGDRKQDTSDPTGRGAALITPHGDRKRRIGRYLNPYEVVLITPHGDRKPPACLSRPGRPRGPHYPSWGSETLARGPQVPPRMIMPVLITPHGDRKPLSRRDLMVPLCRLVTITRVLDTANGRAGHDLCA